MSELLNETSENTGSTAGSAPIAVNLAEPGAARRVAAKVKTAIDDYCAKTYDDGHRKHLGASLIGHECKRYLFFVFRWVYHPPTTGRQQRLFNRGHREEDRYVEWLKGIGAQVWTHDTSQPPKPDGTYPQYRVSAVMGHFGGSLDGIVRLPDSYGLPFPILAEFKTNGTGKGFADLMTLGMPVAKPQHFAQTSTYGADPVYSFQWCLYFNINKNDDDLHVELVKLDWNLGRQMKLKAEQVIMSQVPPPKLSLDQTYVKCKYCDFAAHCHRGMAAEVNCRSCSYAQPIEGGQWLCTLPAHAGFPPLPDHIIKVGCPAWNDITKLDA